MASLPFAGVKYAGAVATLAYYPYSTVTPCMVAFKLAIINKTST